MGIVYKITNLKNNRVYIGLTTKSITKRFNEHKRIAKNPEKNKSSFSYIHKAFIKHGVGNFSIEQLDSAENIEELKKLETFYIEKYKSNVNVYGDEFGYNLTAGGDGVVGYKYSEEQTKAISDRMIGKFNGEKNPFYGKKHTEETKLKITIKRKENKEKNALSYSGENSSQSKLTNKDVIEIINLYNSGKSIAEIKKIKNSKSVGSIINKKIWKHISKDYPINKRSAPPNVLDFKTQIQSDIDNNLSIKQISEKYNFSWGTIVKNFDCSKIKKRHKLDASVYEEIYKKHLAGVNYEELKKEYLYCKLSLRKIVKAYQLESSSSSSESSQSLQSPSQESSQESSHASSTSASLDFSS